MIVRSKLLLPLAALTLAFAFAAPALADDMGKGMGKGMGNGTGNGAGQGSGQGGMSQGSGSPMSAPSGSGGMQPSGSGMGGGSGMGSGSGMGNGSGGNMGNQGSRLRRNVEVGDLLKTARRFRYKSCRDGEAGRLFVEKLPRLRAFRPYAWAFAVSSIPSAFMTAIVVFSVGLPSSLNER